MKGLTREQRAAIFNLDPPSITGNGPCPWEAGTTYAISSRVSLKVTSIRRRRQGGWALMYEIHDTRDDIRNIRRTPPVVQDEEIRKGFDSYGYPAEPTPDIIKQAAQESAYTSAPTSLSDAGEAIDERSQDTFTKEAQKVDGLREQRRREKADLVDEYRRAKAQAARAGIDTTKHDRVIKDRIERIKRASRDKAA